MGSVGVGRGGEGASELGEGRARLAADAGGRLERGQLLRGLRRARLLRVERRLQCRARLLCRRAALLLLLQPPQPLLPKLRGEAGVSSEAVCLSSCYYCRWGWRRR
jgi:hypothetical protein